MKKPNRFALFLNIYLMKNILSKKNLLLSSISLLAVLSTVISLYTLGKGGTKYYRVAAIKRSVMSDAAKKALRYAEGLYRECMELAKNFQEAKEAYEQNPKPSLKRKKEKLQKELEEKTNNYNKIVNYSLTNIITEFFERKLPKSIQAVKKKKNCRSLIPLQCTFTLGGNKEGAFRRILLQADLDLTPNIHPKDDYTQILLQEMGLEEPEEEKKEKTKESEKKDEKKTEEPEKNNTDKKETNA